jgi:hypothetical protein
MGRGNLAGLEPPATFDRSLRDYGKLMGESQCGQRGITETMEKLQQRRKKQLPHSS